jgi:dimethylglycine dehydrogenase
MAERDGKSARQILATLEVDATDADATGYEPIWNGSKRVGYVTSGGFGYRIGKSLALALIDRDQVVEGRELTVHVVGVERRAWIIADSPYDQAGARMRG